MPNAAPEPLIKRFQDDVASLINTPAPAPAPSPEEDCREADDTKPPRLAVAVSGGPDSMALLWLASRSFPGRVMAATVDHRLRDAARDEARMVGDWCGAHNVPHVILTPDEAIRGSVQAAARAARYALLNRWRKEQGLDWLMTAHHADDQRETMLMRLNRSSGVGGLAGIRARNGTVIRPLLSWRRAELQEIVTMQGVPHVHDPSNDDEAFDRVAMRKRLAGLEWIDPIALSRSAAACGDAEEALIWMTDTLAEKYIRRDPGGRITLLRWDFPAEMQRRLVTRMIAMAGGADASPRGETLDRALASLRGGEKASVGNWLLAGGVSWTLSPAPRRRN